MSRIFLKWHFKSWERGRLTSPFITCGCSPWKVRLPLTAQLTWSSSHLRTHGTFTFLWYLVEGSVFPGGRDWKAAFPVHFPFLLEIQLDSFPVQLDGVMPWGLAEGGWPNVVCTLPALAFTSCSHLLFSLHGGPTTRAWQEHLGSCLLKWPCVSQLGSWVALWNRARSFHYQMDCVCKRNILEVPKMQDLSFKIASVLLTPAVL